jgi:hypothetical protein
LGLALTPFSWMFLYWTVGDTFISILFSRG